MNRREGMASTLQFIDSAETMGEVHYADSGERVGIYPVVVAVCFGDALAWKFGGVRGTEAVRVRAIDPIFDDEGYRLEVESLHEQEVRFRRPSSVEESEYYKVCKKHSDASDLNLLEYLKGRAEEVDALPPLPRRDKIFWFAFLEALDTSLKFRPLAAVLASGSNLSFIPADGHEESILPWACAYRSHCSPGRELECLEDLSRRGREVSFSSPMAVKAVDPDDAMELVRRKLVRYVSVIRDR